ncbi:Beta-1,2-xylosyltransferase 1 [Colletotrichum siamense]|nr:Beta-1,2-xylosyltransferase 1 [Colletotrichum siamense]
MAAPLKRHGSLAASIVLFVCTAWITSRYNSSAAFERPIHFSILTLLESGLAIAAWAKWQSPDHGSHDQGYQLVTFSSSSPHWKRRIQASIDFVRNRHLLSSPSIPLGTAIVLRTLLFWRTIRTIHCSWESFETFLPVFITLYLVASPTAISLQQPLGDQTRSRRCFNAAHVRYLFIAVVWACAARSTLALSTQSAGAICPPGSLRWERQIPLAQIVTVALDAFLLVRLSRWRQETAEDAPQAWAFASRLFLGSAGVLAVLACFSFYNLRNIRWAFVLHYVAVRDLVVDSTVVSAAILSGFYVMKDLHPSTLAMVTTASGVYAHQIFRMLQTSAPVDDSLLYMVSGGVTIAGVGLLLRYDKDISGMSGSGADHRLVRFLTGWYVVLVGFLCGTYLVFYPDLASIDTLSFPDLLSVEHAKSDTWMLQANQSRTLDEAVRNYRVRYGMPPPPKFDKWFEYAMENGSPIIDDFTQINDDLLPFWGVQPEVLRQRTSHALALPWLGMGGLRIRGGKIDISPGTPGSHMWMMESMQEMIEPFAQHLPDMDFAINLNDECRVAIPFEDTQALQNDGLDSRARLLSNPALKPFDASKQLWPNNDTVLGPKVKSPYFADHIRDEIYYDFVAPACPPDSPARNTRWWSRREACRDCLLPHAVRVYENGLENYPVVSNWTAATDLCHQPDLAYLHGFLLSPAAAIFTKAPFPVFSQSKTSGFADILIPSPWNFDDKAGYDEESDVEFESKENVMFWRGSATDGYAARGSWQSFLRARFVAAANMWENAWTMPSATAAEGEVVRSDAGPRFDVGFVGEWRKCHEGDCDAERDTFWDGHDEPTKNKVKFQEHWKYAHLMDLDGAGFSGRFIPFLRSKSLVYRSGVFRTWLAERVHAWRHYVPVDVRLHELKGLLWFFGVDYEGKIRAAQIAEEGRVWAAQALRKEDMRIYMFRLLLEWGRLVDDGREELGFA